MKKLILVAGSINMDLVVEVGRLPAKGETVFGKTIRYIPGGKGANQAVAASRLGAEVALIGKVGEDHFGGELLNFLKSEELRLDGVTKSPLPSGLAVVTVDGKGGGNTIVVLRGSNGEVTEDYIDEHQNLVKESNLILSTFETPVPSAERLFTLAKKFNKTAMLNTAPALEVPKNMWANIDYLVLNEKELSHYVPIKDLKNENQITSAAKNLQKKTGGIVIITIGARGAITITKSGVIRTAGIKVNAIDTTAAGDCFIGALAVQLNNGVNLEEALDFSNRAAAISVGRWGASSSLPHLKEIKS